MHKVYFCTSKNMRTKRAVSYLYQNTVSMTIKLKLLAFSNSFEPFKIRNSFFRVGEFTGGFCFSLCSGWKLDSPSQRLSS